MPNIHEHVARWASHCLELQVFQLYVYLSSTMTYNIAASSLDLVHYW